MRILNIDNTQYKYNNSFKATAPDIKELIDLAYYESITLAVQEAQSRNQIVDKNNLKKLYAIYQKNIEQLKQKLTEFSESTEISYKAL